MRIVHRDQIRPRLKSALDPPQRSGEGAAAVREGDAQPRQPLEHSAEDDRADGERDLRGHSDQPGQPVLAHPRLAHHVPRMHEHRRAQLLGAREDRKQRGLGEIPVVHVRTDFDPQKAELRHAAIELPDGAIGGLHGERAEADESPRMLPAERSFVVVQQAREIVAARKWQLVGEEDRDGGEHLEADARFVAFLQANGGIPAVAPDLPEQRSVLAQQAGATLVDPLEAHRAPARQLRREHVRVHVKASHACGRTCGRSCSPGCPSSARTPAQAAGRCR